MVRDKKDDRQFAVGKILEIWGQAELGDMSVRKRKTPFINVEATTLKDLINWTKEECFEPVETCSMTKEELKVLVDQPMEVPKYSCHTQSTERVVQQVKAAASKAVGFTRRDGYVRARAEHRQMMAAFTSKKSILHMMDK